MVNGEQYGSVLVNHNGFRFRRCMLSGALAYISPRRMYTTMMKTNDNEQMRQHHIRRIPDTIRLPRMPHGGGKLGHTKHV